MKTLAIDSLDDLPDAAEAVIDALAGRTVVAFRGEMGAGKTTLFKLLERMYDPTEGTILFGDRDVRDFKLSAWRKSFAIVSQDKPLLSGTVRDNILYGVERKVTEEELIHVAKMANVYDFVMDTLTPRWGREAPTSPAASSSALPSPGP